MSGGLGRLFSFSRLCGGLEPANVLWDRRFRVNQDGLQEVLDKNQENMVATKLGNRGAKPKYLSKSGNINPF